MEIRKDFDSRKRSKLSRTILHIPSLEDFEKTYTSNVSLDDVIKVCKTRNKGS